MPYTRLIAGFLLALAIAAAARRLRALTTSGAVAATVLGTMTVAAGWRWGALLVLFFLSSSALSHMGGAAKAARTQGMVAKGGERDAYQVLANGGLFAAAAVVWLVAPAPRLAALAVGALAAAASDTWATEIGTLAPARPHSILTGRLLEPGASGGITVLGTMGAAVGAAFIGALALALGLGAAVASGAAIGGLAGSTADSLLGAALQSRWWCDRCECVTERRVHSCGEPTRHHGGLRWLDNDMINLLSSVIGAVVAAALVA